jgi:Polymerase beta, Nucleotidyltransferase
MWQTRLRDDRAALDERLSPDQWVVLGGVPQMFENVEPGDPLHLDFVVVFGSYARGEQRESSDVDIYFEVANLPRPISLADHGRRYQALGMPRNTLLGNLRARRDMGSEIAADALVFSESEDRYRHVLIAAEEEGLL